MFIMRSSITIRTIGERWMRKPKLAPKQRTKEPYTDNTKKN